MLLHKDTTKTGDLIIKATGDFDAFAAEKIRPELEAISNSNEMQNIILDLTEVTFIDSSGIGAIVFLYKRLIASKCTFHLTGVQGQPRELFELLRIHKAIPTSWYEKKSA